MNSIAHALVAAALLAGASAASAQPFTTPPPPAPPRPLTIAAPVEQTLDNGMRVITARREGVPIVSALLVVLSGSEADPANLSGLASLSAGLLTEGTRRHSAPELAAAAEALGGSLESGAGWGQSTVSMTVTTPKLDAALGLIAEVALEPTFPTEELDRVRSQTLDGLKVAYANPSQLAGLASARLAYGGSPWGHPAEGTPGSLPRVMRADLIAIHDATFRPDRAVLILSGDIDAGTALALARAHFGAWKVPAAPASALPPVPAAAASGPGLAIIDMPSAGQAGVSLALPLPPRQGSEWAVGAVLNAVLGGDYSSRLNQEIRIKRGLSYGADSRIEARSASGLFSASIQTKNESTAEVVGLLQGELDRIMQSPIGADELQARKTTLIGGFSRSVETTAGLASAIDALIVSGRRPTALNRQIGTLEAVSAAEVQRYAVAHLGAAERRIAVVGVADRFAPGLKATAPTLQVLSADELDLDRTGGLKREAASK
jgi:zinc protease